LKQSYQANQKKTLGGVLIQSSI